MIVNGMGSHLEGVPRPKFGLIIQTDVKGKKNTSLFGRCF